MTGLPCLRNISTTGQTSQCTVSKNGHTTYVMNKKAKIFTIQLSESMDVIPLPVPKQGNGTNISDETIFVLYCC